MTHDCLLLTPRPTPRVLRPFPVVPGLSPVSGFVSQEGSVGPPLARLRYGSPTPIPESIVGSLTTDLAPRLSPTQSSACLHSWGHGGRVRGLCVKKEKKCRLKRKMSLKNYRNNFLGPSGSELRIPSQGTEVQSVEYTEICSLNRRDPSQLK